MGEYAVVTATVALLAISVATTTGKGVSRALPLTVPAARAFVVDAARTQRVSPEGAPQALRAAPYRSVPLRTLFAVGWVGGTRDRSACGLARVLPSLGRAEAASAIRRDAHLATRLRKLGIPVDAAAGALTRGLASACG